VALCPVTDMVACFDLKLSDEGDAAERFMKCAPADGPEALERYLAASPLHILPNAVPTVLVSSRGDIDVPLDMVVAYYDAVLSSGGVATLILGSDESDHYSLINSDSSAWAAALVHIKMAVHWQPPSPTVSSPIPPPTADPEYLHVQVQGRIP
jgi:hypothetical protein